MIIDKKSMRIYKQTIILGAPIVGQELLNSAVNFVDILMIGKAGDSAVSAVGTGNEILFLFNLMAFGIISGSSIYFGQFWGKSDLKSLHKTMGYALIFSMIAAILFFVPSQFFTDSIIRFYINDENVIRIGVDYLKIVSFTFFLNAIIMTINSANRCTGYTTIPMMTSIVALFSNVTLNYVFIFVLRQGAAGAAKATLLARIIEVIAQIVIMKKLRLPTYTKLRNYFVKDMVFLKDYIKVVTPVILNEVVWSMGVTLYKESYGELGKEAFSATVITAPVAQIFVVLGTGIGSATGILIANSLGSGDADSAIEYSKKSKNLAVFFSICMGVLMFFSTPLVLSFYTDLSETTKMYSRYIIYILSVLIVIKTYNFTSIVGILRNGGDTVFCLLIDMMGVWLVGVPLAYLGAHILHLPIHIVYIMANCEELFKLIPCMIRVNRKKWAQNLVAKYD